jgi:hypothetical protein
MEFNFSFYSKELRFFTNSHPSNLQSSTFYKAFYKKRVNALILTNRAFQPQARTSANITLDAKEKTPTREALQGPSAAGRIR